MAGSCTLSQRTFQCANPSGGHTCTRSQRTFQCANPSGGHISVPIAPSHRCLVQLLAEAVGTFLLRLPTHSRKQILKAVGTQLSSQQRVAAVLPGMWQSRSHSCGHVCHVLAGSRSLRACHRSSILQDWHKDWADHVRVLCGAAGGAAGPVRLGSPRGR